MTDTWYRITNAVSPAGVKTADVDIFDAIGFYAVDAAELAKDVRALDAEQIVVNINSPGGDVFDGITILNALRQHPARTVANVMGLAASAASFIACGLDETVMADNAQMMIHDASGIVIGNAKDMHEMAGVLDQISDNIASVYARKAGGTAANWRDVMRGEKWYTAQEAVDAGLADRIDSGRKGEPLADPKPKNLAVKPHTVAAARSALNQISQLFPAEGTHHAEPAPAPVTNHQKEEDPMSDTLKAIAKQLGVTDAADDAAILSAIADLNERATNKALPEGVVTIDQGVLDELKNDAAAGRQALQRQDAERRDAIVNAALRDGKITAAARDKWRNALDHDEAGTIALMDDLVAVVPVENKGRTAVDEKAVDADEALYNRLYTAKSEEN